MNIAQSINKSTANFTMYKGMSFGLLGIWVVALLLSFFEAIAYSPLGMIGSLLAVTMSTYGASYLCGRLVGVAAHGESSLITGLILALIITPANEFSGLAVFIFAGIIAGVSKFALVYNRRHIFNPAALAAVALTVVGLGGASWWVATPVLTPVVLLTVLMSLYKTRRFDVAGVFLAISIPILLIVFATDGTPFLDSVYLLASWPLLFVAGIMLTEPLTLPPRKWQMYAVAAVVALLFVVPFNLPFVDITPAIALLAGNVVAALFLLREKITLVLKSRIALTPTTDELVFVPNKPLRYAAGQYLELDLPHKNADFRGYRRSFSFSSAPGKDEVSLGVKFYEPSSSYKSALKKMPLGTTISATGYWGDFVLPKDPNTPLLYVAGGIGITPFISHLKASQNYTDIRNVVLLYAISNPNEIAYQNVLVEAGIKVIIISEQKVTLLPAGWTQIEERRLSEEILKQAVPDIGIREAYVSGPPLFVESVKGALKVLKAKRIKTDYFNGY